MGAWGEVINQYQALILNRKENIFPSYINLLWLKNAKTVILSVPETDFG